MPTNVTANMLSNDCDNINNAYVPSLIHLNLVQFILSKKISSISALSGKENAEVQVAPSSVRMLIETERSP